MSRSRAAVHVFFFARWIAASFVARLHLFEGEADDAGGVHVCGLCVRKRIMCVGGVGLRRKPHSVRLSSREITTEIPDLLKLILLCVYYSAMFSITFCTL